MLQVGNRNPVTRVADTRPPSTAMSARDPLNSLTSLARRRAGIMLLIVALSLLCAFVYLQLATPKYLAKVTLVIEIGFLSRSPERAAEVANATAEAYILDQLEAKYEATRRAGGWLQDRIQELRQEASTAEKAVLDFKKANNIVDTGGRLMGEQQ